MYDVILTLFTIFVKVLVDKIVFIAMCTMYLTIRFVGNYKVLFSPDLEITHYLAPSSIVFNNPTRGNLTTASLELWL